MLGLALGGKTYKLKFGHHGGNHPVKDLATGRIAITSQNHGFNVDVDSLPAGTRMTHVNLYDGTAEGLENAELGLFSVQYHPEASPGPHESGYLFARFSRMMDARAWQGRAPGAAPRARIRGAGAEGVPKRTDIHSILIIGTGPIVIGQACEFDYSGTQACKALREEGFRVVLVNSNPATIMTDPEMADATYIEPITVPMLEKIIEAERPDALLPTLGGQTGLNIAIQLADKGVLDRFGVRMIGADREAIRKSEDRKLFKQAMERIGLDVPRSGLAHTLEEAGKIAGLIGFPLIIRPSFTLGGTGGAVAEMPTHFEEMARRGLDASMIGEVLIEESIVGWKEFELEVMRDRADNVVIVCSIENFDPMGVHTGDSITVAPAQTLTDREYQRMRDAAIACIREIGVETGGSNIQFAVHPGNGRMVVIEMNPRVSRSSALASKATGFPSPRSRRSSPSATRWTRSPTTSRRARRPPSSRPSTTAW